MFQYVSTRLSTLPVTGTEVMSTIIYCVPLGVFCEVK